MNTGLNIGDVVFQLIAFLIPITCIGLIVYFIKSSKKRAKQLQRIEEKVNKLSEKQ
ncbi:DUF4083 domain-containing protein [Priestia taiwanensis]|uniref:DUF4083 domain-containing protein n=1 Tax=Priestia taiwanensis TaxID=1347902 RepID=A0A917ENH9_9BACI|nr:DUF4083 domain-containing protein [Priestia taiwanensis]MBM7362135.1 preprotein translocase subunit YajC [Priestia taiwanensis]GGE59740.1 hypothetical protein GCM10007140_07580 [Priestia taiwanensis]